MEIYKDRWQEDHLVEIADGSVEVKQYLLNEHTNEWDTLATTTFNSREDAVKAFPQFVQTLPSTCTHCGAYCNEDGTCPTRGCWGGAGA